MLNKQKPYYLLVLLAICKQLAYCCASMHYTMIKLELVKQPVYLLTLTCKKLKTLQSVWYARIVRRIISVLVRTLLRKSLLQLINFNIVTPTGTGCIIITCHTPWKRFLVQWCLENKFALIVGGGIWKNRKRSIQNLGAGTIELRRLIRHLQLNGRVIIACDVSESFKTCPLNFLGKDTSISLFAERLATIAKVPIVTAIPVLNNNTIDFISGPVFQTCDLTSHSTVITPQIISFFEKQIECKPSIWPQYVK